MKEGSTTKVTIDDGEDNTIKLTNNIEIDRTVATSNEKLGNQTEGGGQLLTPDHIRWLGNHGEEPSSRLVLRGTFTFPLNTINATKHFITACKYNPEVATVTTNDDISIRYNNTKKLLGMRKEKNCTYGKHMEHYKAVMKYDWLIWLYFQKEGDTSTIRICSDWT